VKLCSRFAFCIIFSQLIYKPKHLFYQVKIKFHIFPKGVYTLPPYRGNKTGDDKLLLHNKLFRKSKTRNALRTRIKFRRNNFYTFSQKKRRIFRVGLLNTQTIQLISSPTRREFIIREVSFCRLRHSITRT